MVRRRKFCWTALSLGVVAGILSEFLRATSITVPLQLISFATVGITFGICFGEKNHPRIVGPAIWNACVLADGDSWGNGSSVSAQCVAKFLFIALTSYICLPWKQSEGDSTSQVSDEQNGNESLPNSLRTGR